VIVALFADTFGAAALSVAAVAAVEALEAAGAEDAVNSGVVGVAFDSAVLPPHATTIAIPAARSDRVSSFIRLGEHATPDRV